MKKILKTLFLLGLLQGSTAFAIGRDLRAETTPGCCETVRSLFRQTVGRLFCCCKPSVNISFVGKEEREGEGEGVKVKGFLSIYGSEESPYEERSNKYDFTTYLLTSNLFNGFAPDSSLALKEDREGVQVKISRNLIKDFGSLSQVLEFIGQQKVKED